jgi:hypothetical protein
MRGAISPLPHVFVLVLLNQAQGMACFILVCRILGCEDYVDKTLLNAYLWCSCINNSDFYGSFILLLLKRYNLYKVLARSTTFFHLPLSCTIFFQLFTFKLLLSPKTSFSQRVFRSPNWSFGHGFPSLNFLYTVIFVQHALTSLVFVF